MLLEKAFWREQNVQQGQISFFSLTPLQDIRTIFNSAFELAKYSTERQRDPKNLQKALVREWNTRTPFDEMLGGKNNRISNEFLFSRRYS